VAARLNQFPEKPQHFNDLLMVQVLDDFDRVNPVKRAEICGILELSEDELKVWLGIARRGKLNRKRIAVAADNETGSLCQEMADCAGTAACIQHAIARGGRCYSLDEPHFRLMPETLGWTSGLESFGLVIAGYNNRVTASSLNLVVLFDHRALVIRRYFAP
jgi:hypothetical protein